jgi:hypothetical protein
MLHDKPGKIEFRNTLSQDQKKALFYTAVTDDDVCRLLSASPLALEHFQELDLYLWYLWDSANKLYKKHRKAPAIRELRLELDQRVNDVTDPVEDSICNELFDALADIEALEVIDRIGLKAARDYLSQFIADRTWRTVRQLTQQRGKTPESLRETVKSLHSEIAAIESLAAAPIEKAFQPGFEKKLKLGRKIPTGVPFVDDFLDGGMASGEVYLLLGPFGSCKTLLLQQMSESVALLRSTLWAHSNKRSSLGLVYFVSYEMTKTELQARALAHTAQIPVNVVSSGGPFSSPGNLFPRDIELFRRQYDRGLYIPSEKERIASAVKRLNTNWRILDFSGKESDELAGGGLCAEIQARIEADLRTYEQRGIKRHAAAVFVDYIRLMAARRCMLHQLDASKHMRLLCLNSAEDARQNLTYHFKCPVFMAHQLNSKGNELHPGVIPDKTCAAEANAIAENFNYVLVVSKPTDESPRLARMNCQKQRRSGGRPAITIHIQGDYGQVAEVNALWSWDDLTKRFTRLTSVDSRYEEQDEDTAGNRPFMPRRLDRFDGQKMDLFDMLG